ncbi:16S rRNA (cytosine(967)-C(5))-methyltransferase RsmB [Porticoccus sp.]|uniref:16S rRNA (cytosine(967)-C(5))-methyltransferase RsmB n=1 Tax=Porticoccus sp. TaxID=2024853 RepID=UPI003F6A1EDC
MNVRVAAARIIASVLRGEGSLNTLLPEYLARVDDRDRGLLQQLCYGTLRFYPRLSVYLAELLAKPFKIKDFDIEATLACSLYQLLETRIPPHAVVNEAVDTCLKLKKNWAKGLTNAVLRRFLRERVSLDIKLGNHRAFQTAHPDWLIDLWQAAWPEQLDQLVAANNHQPPMTLRANQMRCSRDEYLATLTEAGIEASPTRFSDVGITLEQPCDVTNLPGFAEGDASVQDEAAQLAAQLLAPEPGQRILDACCAPGGKTGHILELLNNQGDVIAIDIEAERLARVSDNLLRLGLQAKLLTADAANPASWWDGKQYFDCILLDAPCSATGVIRRHPDVKLLRKPADIAKLATLQLSLLKALWPLLAEGGALLYATCSTLPQENDQVITDFVRENNSVRLETVATQAGIATSAGRQLMPEIGGHDGFYFARLVKTGMA